MKNKTFYFLGIFLIGAIFFSLGYFAAKHESYPQFSKELYKARLMSNYLHLQDTLRRIPYETARTKFNQYKDKRTRLFSFGHKKYSEYDIIEINELEKFLARFSLSGKYLILRKGIEPDDTKEINTYLFVVDDEYNMLTPERSDETGTTSFLIMDDLVRCPPMCPESLNY